MTKHSIALVNLKPIVRGHCLVIPRRVTPRFCDLSAEEVCDLWCTAQRVGPKLEGHFGADALTLAIQDGTAAGQTVPHVHVHIVPRRRGDFRRNDEVYDALDGHDATPAAPGAKAVDADEDREARKPDEMAREAAELRALFADSLPIPE